MNISNSRGERMKKFWHLWLTALLTVGLLSVCNEENASSGAKDKGNHEESVFPVTVKDAQGNDVTLQEAPDRIVSLTPSNTEILFSLGLDEEIVGVNDHDNYPEQVAEKTQVGGMEFNTDAVEAGDWSMYSEEEFVYKNLTYAGDDEAIKTNKAFSTMKAVQHNALTVGDGDLTSRQGPHLALGVEALAKAINPEAFNE